MDRSSMTSKTVTLLDPEEVDRRFNELNIKLDKLISLIQLKKTYSVSEVAIMISKSESTVRNMHNDGRLRGIQDKDGSTIVFPIEVVQSYLQNSLNNRIKR